MRKIFNFLIILVAMLVMVACGQGMNDNKIPEGYLSYIENDSDLNEGNKFMYPNYALIYIDDDDVPEVVFDGRCEALGYVILSLQKDTIYRLQTWRYSFSYIEKSGLVGYDNGSMGHYYIHVFRLDKNGFHKIMDWDRREGLDENGNLPVWTLNGKPASQEDADSMKHEIFLSKGKEIMSDSVNWISRLTEEDYEE